MLCLWVCFFICFVCSVSLLVCLIVCLVALRCFALLCSGGWGRKRRRKRAPHLGESRFFARRRCENVENRNYRLPIAEKSKNENFGTQKHEICTAPRRDAQIRNSIGKFQSEMRPEARTSKGGIARASLKQPFGGRFSERGTRPFWGAPVG